MKKTYKSFTLEEALFKSKILQKLKKQNKNSISDLKEIWKNQSPVWAKELIPYKLQKEIMFFKSKENSLIFQYKEKELIQICESITNKKIKRIKIIKD